MNKLKSSRIDWLITLAPFIIIMALAGVLFAFPDASNDIISKVRYFFGNTMGIYYLIIGIGVLVISIFLSFSKYGNVVLGEPNEKPKYTFFVWGSMMFTCGLAADILFYSFAEWVMYATNPHIEELGSVAEWAGAFPLFHWSFIPWAFYLVLAVAFGFMLHVRKRTRQRYSEACRPVIGNYADGLWGRIIDLFALFALLAGTATTFSVATPLLAAIIVKLFGITIGRTAVTIIILLITCAVYTYAVLHGFKGISFLAKLCIYLFFGLLIIVLLIGGQGKFIIENGFQSLGKMLQNFIELSTFTDPERTSNFPQDWTIYYWAYWMVWCVATPFFIGKISKGRTIKNTILGGYGWGLAGTFTSFIILGNYGLAQQMKHGIDISGMIAKSGDYSTVILKIFDTLPLASLGLLLLVITMIAFYSTTFDALTMVVSSYSYKKLDVDEEPDKKIRVFWAIIFILFPIALIFAENSMYSLQSVAIIAAFPIGFIILLIVISFFKDANKYLQEKKENNRDIE